MDTTSWLQTLAEVAIAMAGFSAVVTAFNRDAARMAPIQANRLFAIVSISLVVAFFSILPGIVQGFGLSESGSFRIAGLASLGVQVCLYAAVIRGYRTIVRNAEQVWRIGVVLAWCFMALSVAAIVGCVIGWPTGSEAACYLLAQTSTLTVAGTRLAGLTVVMAAASAGVEPSAEREAPATARPPE